MKTCKLHSIETFGTVDGPGIRFVAFLQGCPLKCKYCHNRDTWDMKNFSEELTSDQLIKKIMHSKPYFKSSKGGVTISGGEPLMQADFLIELFQKLKKQNIHIAIDTAGSLPLSDTIKELLKYVDLVLLDIKHIDNEKCVDLTGLPNENTLNFAKYLNENNIPMWIRQVIIPGITDDIEDLQKEKEFLAKLGNIENIELLPYHDLGKFKWMELTGSYPLEEIRTATPDDIERAKEILGIKN